MLGFSGPELLLTTGIGLLVLGPTQLKQTIRFVAKSIRYIKGALADIANHLDSSIDDKK